MRQRLPLETQTLYAELLEHLLGLEAQRSVSKGIQRGLAAADACARGLRKRVRAAAGR